MYDGPPIADEVNPTHDEIRAWAYSGAVEPMEDWDVIIAEPDNIDVLLDLVADPDCPSRAYLLRSLYCMVGHSDRADTRLVMAAERAITAPDPLVRTWAQRLRSVLDNQGSFDRSEWCGWKGG